MVKPQYRKVPTQNKTLPILGVYVSILPSVECVRRVSSYSGLTLTLTKIIAITNVIGKEHKSYLLLLFLQFSHSDVSGLSPGRTPR